MATYYLNADTGNDTTGDGSSTLPWLTISHAVDNSASGDTIFLQSSTNDYAHVAKACNGQHLLGENRENVKISNGGASTGGLNLLGSVENITFYNYTLSNHYQYMLANITTVKNCTFRDLIYSGGVNAVIYGGSIITVSGCIFDMPNTLSVWFAVNAYFHFYNNIFIQPGGYSDWITGNATTIYIYIKNNIFKFINADHGLRRGVLTIGELQMGNNCYASAYDFGATYLYPSDLVNVDPLFVDEANGNYQLRPNSPCIDAGTIL